MQQTPSAPKTQTRAKPRKCETPGCNTLYFTRKRKGYATGYGGKCHRCHAAVRAGKTPGPREHQPAGHARVPLRTYIRRELDELITPEVLARHGVSTSAQLASLALARLLERESLA